MNNPNINQLYGSLLGTVIGDAYGLPFEGLSPSRLKRLFPQDGAYHLIPVINGGMVSDDSEHAIMTVQAYIASGGDVSRFGSALRWRLMAWLLTLPAGVGLATGRSIFKMMLGFRQSGVYSAGNGGAMRSAALGVLCDDLNQLKTFVHTSTKLTHTDPKAVQGSLAVALLAWAETRRPTWSSEQILRFVAEQLEDKALIALLFDDTTQQNPPPAQGVTGYMYDTVPAVVWAWRQYRHEPLRGLNWLIGRGGDTDTTCAIFGGIVGVRHGVALFDVMQGAWCEPVIRPKLLQTLAKQAWQTNVPNRPARLFSFWTYPRNVVFLIIVLLHGFRRLLPPY